MTRSEEDDHARQDKKIKIEDSERQRLKTLSIAATVPDADADSEAKAAEAEANRKAELRAKLEAERLAEEQREAEKAKKEEEEMRRRDAERKAEEIRLQHQRRMAEERRLEEERQKQALPSALRHVLGLTTTAKSEKQKYVQRHFLPVQVVRRSDLGSTVEGEGEGKGDELWMLSYQAAAILTNAGAADLLELSVDPRAERSVMNKVTKFDATIEQRRAMLPCLQSSSLVHDCPMEADLAPLDDLMAELLMAERSRLQLAEDRSKFLAMNPLHWIRFSDFYNAVTGSNMASSPHLSGLDIDIRYDCCLDPTPFVADGGAEVVKAATNGVKTDGVEERSKITLGDGLGSESDGTCFLRAGPGVTTFTIIQS